MAKEQVGLGLFAEENFTTGGFQSGRAKIVKSRFTQVQPDPQKPGREPMWVMSIKDAGGQDHEIRWGLGQNAATRFKIEEGGKRIVGVGGAMLNKSCKTALLIKSILAAGYEFDASALPQKQGQSPDVSVFDGEVVDFESAAMDVGDKILADRKAKGQGAPTVLLVKAFVSSSGKAESTEDEADTASEDDSSEGEADQQAIVAKFIELAKKQLVKGALTLTEWKTKVLAAVEEDDDLKQYSDDLMNLLGDEDNLTGEDFGLELDGKGKARTVADPNAKLAKKGLKLGK